MTDVCDINISDVEDNYPLPYDLPIDDDVAKPLHNPIDKKSIQRRQKKPSQKQLKWSSARQSILLRPDKSIKKSIDLPILKVYELINEWRLCEDYVTTSSCSGRIAVFFEGSENRKRDGCLALAVHETDVLTADMVRCAIAEDNGSGRVPCLHMEPLLLHVRCKDVTAALRLLHQVIQVGGWKQSPGIINTTWVVGIKGSEKMYVPLLPSLLAAEGVLESLVEEANKKLHKNMKDIQKLEGQIELFLSGSYLPNYQINEMDSYDKYTQI